MLKYVCQVCEWNTGEFPDEAGAISSMVWHFYEQHKEKWREVFGTDDPPIDPVRN